MAEPDADETADGRPGVGAFAAALHVRRNALLGFGLGAAFALAVFVEFAYLADRRYPVAYWLALAFVLAVGVGLLLTLGFTLGSAYRLARRL